MSDRSRLSLPSTSTPLLRSLIALVLVVVILHFGQQVIVPLAMAVLFTFVLTPLVVQVQRLGLPRIPSALSVVVLGLICLATVAWGVESQVVRLASELPARKYYIQKKMSRLSMSNGVFGRLVDTFKNTPDASAVPGQEGQGTKPIYVEKPAQSPLQSLISSAGLFLEPVASAALVLILVVFMLVRREDLRNRVIGLLGHGQLMGTTRVLVESAERLSRFLLMLLAINVGFGVLFGLGLLLIGVPYAFLWGFLAVLLRFVPYVGSWVAAAMPLLLSVAVSPGWTQPLGVLAVFIGLELLAANVAEPLLFGHSTGVSPVALLVAAVFWAWVWGPIGLVLSTPMTVCMVVLGQHVPRLRALSLLLSDQAPLPPHASYYQRLLAGDRSEAASIARIQSQGQGIDRLPDEVLLPALWLARHDRVHAGLSAEDEGYIFNMTGEILREIEAAEALPTRVAPPDTGEAAQPLVLGIPAHHRGEELILQMLDLVTRALPCRIELVSSKTLPVEIEAMIERERPAVVFVSVLPPGGTVQARYLCRRLRRRFADLVIVVGYFGRVKDFDRLLVRLRAAGASYVTTTLLQSRSQIEALLGTPAAGPAPRPAEHARAPVAAGAS